jgi:hypothetical protein
MYVMMRIKILYCIVNDPNLSAKTTIYTKCCFKNVDVKGTPLSHKWRWEEKDNKILLTILLKSEIIYCIHNMFDYGKLYYFKYFCYVMYRYNKLYE